MSKSHGLVYSSAKSPHHPGKYGRKKRGVELGKKNNGRFSILKLNFSNKGLWHIRGKLRNSFSSKESSLLCHSTETHNTETKECIRQYDNSSASDISRTQSKDENPVMPQRIIHSSQGLAEACKYVYNDAKYVNERARNDIFLLSHGILRLDARARQDVAILSSEFLKLDAPAREDTEKVDHDVKRRAERLHHLATVLKNKAQSRLKSAADQHWSNGALETDLRRADFCAKQRAMEDALMALEFIKNIHDMMVSKVYKLKKDSISDDDKAGRITLEKNGRTLDLLFGDVPVDRITAIQEAYWSMASALSEADGIDYTDPEELELLVTTLIDLDAMDGKSSVSLLAECSISPDVNTRFCLCLHLRKALANALSAAPSMWTLGNAGMGALQRLAEDSSPAIAAAASKTMYELKRQWEIEEGDNWRFMMNKKQIERDIKEGEETVLRHVHKSLYFTVHKS